MARALVGLGSNLGDRSQTLDAACRSLQTLVGRALVRRSAWYETAPVGGPPGQEPFLNGAVVVETTLDPTALLRMLHAVEETHGRRRDVPWGPRTLDLDLLLYDDVVLRTAELTLPHPRLSFRKFVLRGAAEIAGAWRHPLLQATLDELWRHLRTAPRYAAFVGRSAGFRAQFAAEAADAARARLVEPTAGDVPAFEALATADGLTKAQVLEFIAARVEAVAATLATADDGWVVDDGFLPHEAMELAGRLPQTERPQVLGRVQSLCEGRGTVPRLLARLATPGDDPAPGTGLPEAALDVTRREEALMEFAAALEAAS